MARYWMAEGLDEEAQDFVRKSMEEHRIRTFFARLLAPSPFHWHFQQAYEALVSEYYLPGISGLLNGIEHSLRATVTTLDGKDLDGDIGTTLSNRLLLEAHNKGMEIDILRMPGESDLVTGVVSRKVNVGLVMLRHDICHGNFRRFRRDVDGIEYFTPECLLPTAITLLDISYKWAVHLNEFLFRHDLKNLSEDHGNIPDNPLFSRL